MCYDEEHRPGLFAHDIVVLASELRYREKHPARVSRRATSLLSAALVSVLTRVLLSMLQGLTSRTARRNSIYQKLHSHPNRNHHLTRGNAPFLSRPVLVPGGYSYGYVPRVLSVRHYAQQTPPGGYGRSGGLPGFNFPMQQQYAKGGALEEFVRAIAEPVLGCCLQLFYAVCVAVPVEYRLDRVGEDGKARSRDRKRRRKVVLSPACVSLIRWANRRAQRSGVLFKVCDS